MTDDFNVLLRGAYESSRRTAQRRVPARALPAGAQDARTAALFRGATLEEADAIAREFAARRDAADAAAFGRILAGAFAENLDRRRRIPGRT